MTRRTGENNSEILAAVIQNNKQEIFLRDPRELNPKQATNSGANCQYILLTILKRAQELVVPALLGFSTVY